MSSAEAASSSMDDATVLLAFTEQIVRLTDSTRNALMESLNRPALVFAIPAGKVNSATKRLATFLASTMASAAATENAFAREDFPASFAICLQMIFALVMPHQPF